MVDLRIPFHRVALLADRMYTQLAKIGIAEMIEVDELLVILSDPFTPKNPAGDNNLEEKHDSSNSP
jgi:hypothetical protein